MRLVNPGENAAEVQIRGVDDVGLGSLGEVRLTIPSGATLTLPAQELESGSPEFSGALGQGSGRWQLEVESDQLIHVMSLMESPTGHLTNLSTRGGLGRTNTPAYPWLRPRQRFRAPPKRAHL